MSYLTAMTQPRHEHVIALASLARGHLNLENAAWKRLSPATRAVLLDEGVHFLNGSNSA